LNITISCKKKFFAFKYYDPTFCRFKMLILFFDLSVVPLDYSLSTEYKRINISLYAKSYLSYNTRIDSSMHLFINLRMFRTCGANAKHQ